MTRVAAWARVSKKDSDQDPNVQFNTLEQYVARKGYDIVARYWEREKRWKTLAEREQFSKMLNDFANTDMFDGILVVRMDRILANLKVYFQVQEILDKNNKWIEFSDTGKRWTRETDMDVDEEFINILRVAHARREIKIDSLRIKEGIDAEQTITGRKRSNKEGRSFHGRPRIEDKNKGIFEEIIEQKKYLTNKEIADKFKISQSSISRILKRRSG